jgi:hypothetical protein
LRWVAEAQGGFGAQRCAVVPVQVAPALVGCEVETSVELDDQLEAGVEDVGELAIHRALPLPGRQGVPPFDVA